MSRRRAHSTDEEDEGYSRKRRKTSDIEDRLESLITRVGEKSTSSLESNLEGLASVLEADLQNYKSKIIRILCDCAVKMPEKQTVYTTLVGLLNAKNYNAGGEFVEMLIRNLKEALKTSQFENARLIVRFLSDLVNCHVIVAGSLLSMFDNFVEVTLEDNIPQMRSDWYVYCVLSALPWVGRELYDKKEVEFNRLLQLIDTYVGKRPKIHVPALQIWSAETPHPQEEYLDCLWAQIKNLQTNKWLERTISRPYLAFDGVLCEALQHTLPVLNPPSHNEDAEYPLPHIIYRMFDYTDVPEDQGVLPGAHAVERYLLEEQLQRILRTLHLERKDCAAALLTLPSRNKIPINYMICEVVFGHLFQLPRPPYMEIFYGSLLIELCKLQPSSMPQVLAQSTEIMYERIETMNTSCIERFSNWFSYHLSNFQFRWSWDDWADELGDKDIEAPKSKFVREVLLKCMRLSYHQQMVEMVPSKIGMLVPKKPQPHYKYEKEGAGSLPGTMVAHQLMSAIKTKCQPDEVLSIMSDLENPLKEEEADATYNPLKIDIFVQTLLYLGSKSFSHAFAALAKFHPVFKFIAEPEEAQVCVLKKMFELWKTHQQMMVVLVDKMLKTQIVECSAVANWVFSPEMSQDFTCFYVWEIMHSTIKKMNKHVAKLQKELEDSKDRLEAAQRRMRDGMEVDDEDDVPKEYDIERLEEKLEAAQSEQKNLFLIIFQRFIIILTEHLAKCESESKDYNSPWYKWVIDRLQQVFLMHHEQVYKYINTLETLLFTSDIDIHILEVFQQFCALRS